MVQQPPSSYESLPSPLYMLPYDLQDKILYELPTDDAVRYKTVCKEWKMLVDSWASGTPMDFTPQPQKPLYVIFNQQKVCAKTLAYNFDKRRWIPFKVTNSDKERLLAPLDLQLFYKASFIISTSRGLVCLLDAKTQDNIFLYNPILNNPIKMLPKVSGDVRSDYCAIALSTNIHSRQYIVAMVKSSRIAGIESTFNMTIKLYRSETCSWANLHNENIVSWQGGDSCVICNGVLYCVVESQDPWSWTQPYSHAIVSYNLSQDPKEMQSLDKTLVCVPQWFGITCGRLVTFDNRLVVVGSIPKEPGSIKGMAIWERCENRLREITRTPKSYGGLICNFFGETFLSSGCENQVFIQSHTSGAILIYDFSTNMWIFPNIEAPYLFKTSYYNGFCLEPRLDIIP